MTRVLFCILSILIIGYGAAIRWMDGRNKADRNYGALVMIIGLLMLNLLKQEVEGKEYVGIDIFSGYYIVKYCVGIS